MVWFFERSAQVLELETRYDNVTAEYVFELRGPHVASETERFTDAEAFRTRLIALERILSGQRWRRNGPPVILPDGWPDRTPSHEPSQRRAAGGASPRQRRQMPISFARTWVTVSDCDSSSSQNTQRSGVTLVNDGNTPASRAPCGRPTRSAENLSRWTSRNGLITRTARPRRREG